MKRLPHVLVVGLAIELLSSLVMALLMLKNVEIAFSETSELITNGIFVAAHVLVAVGTFQLARSLAGRAAIGAKVAATAHVALVVMVGFWVSLQLWSSIGESSAFLKVIEPGRYAEAILWLTTAVGFALIARPVGIAVALPVIAVVGIPVPVLGKLYGDLHSEIAWIALRTVPYIAISALAFFASWSRRDELVEAPAVDAAVAFTRASKALWLRVIAALSLAAITFFVGMAHSNDLVGLFRAMMLLAPIVDAIALALFARAVIVLASTSLAPWLLSSAAAFALGAVGITAGRIVRLYEVFYGHHSGSFRDLASDPAIGGFSTEVVPLIAATAIALVLVTVARLARERNAEDVRENIVIRTGVFVTLMVGAMLVTHFLSKGSMTDAGVAVFLVVAIAGAILYALAIAAKLCAIGGDLVARDPAGLPAAKVVSS